MAKIDKSRAITGDMRRISSRPSRPAASVAKTITGLDQQSRAASSRPGSGGRASPPKKKEKEARDLRTNGAGQDAQNQFGGPRRSGLRGAAPWAARHAARHAAEVRARNAEPPRPGSARATLREPQGAEQIKARVTELHTLLGRIQELKKSMRTEFYALGVLLRRIIDERLYEAKGYASFEQFVEREARLGKSTALDLARIARIFQESAAAMYGLEALLEALRALDEAGLPRTGPRRPLPSKPPHR